MITQHSDGMVVITGDDVGRYRLLTLRSALKLEVLGMTHSGGSVCAVIKREFNLKGNKAKVLAQFEAHLRTKGILQ